MDSPDTPSTSLLDSLDDFCLGQVISALHRELASVSRVSRRFHRLAQRRIIRLFLTGEDGLALAHTRDVAKYAHVYSLWYSITCSPGSLPAATAAILFAAQHCPYIHDLRLAVRYAPDAAPTAAAAGQVVEQQQEEDSERRLFKRWWNSYIMYPCSLAEQLAVAQRLTLVHRLHLRLGCGMTSALHCLALLPRLTMLRLFVLDGLRCWVDLQHLQALKQMPLAWLELEGVSLLSHIPWSEDGADCPLPTEITNWRLARVKGMVRWANALWCSPGQHVVHLEYSDEYWMADHPTLLLPELCHSLTYARVLVLARPPTQPAITWQGVPEQLAACMTAAVLPSRSMRYMVGLEKLRMEHWWMVACSPRCWLALASAPRLSSLVGLVALVTPPRRVTLRRLRWLRGVVAWGGAGLAPLLQVCPGLRGLAVVVEMPAATLDPQLFPPDLFYELHQRLEQMYAEQQQQQEEEQEQQEEAAAAAEEAAAAAEEEEEAANGAVQPQGVPQQEQQQQQAPPAAVPVVDIDQDQQGPVPEDQQQEDVNIEEGGSESDQEDNQSQVNSELEHPLRWPQPMDPGWVSPGVKARCLRYLDLTYRVTGEHLGAAGAALQQLPGLLPRVEVVDLVVPAGLVPALLLALPRLTTVTVLGLVVGVAAGKSEVELEGDTTTTAAQLAAALQPLTLLRELYLEGWQGLSPQQLAARLVGVGPAQQATPAVKLKTVQYRRCGTAGQAPTAAAAAAGQGQAVSSVPTQQQQQQQEAGVLPAWLSVQAVQQGPRPREWRPQNTPWFDQPGVEEGWAGERRPPSTLDEDQHDRMW